MDAQAADRRDYREAKVIRHVLASITPVVMRPAIMRRIEPRKNRNIARYIGLREGE